MRGWWYEVGTNMYPRGGRSGKLSFEAGLVGFGGFWVWIRDDV